MKLLSLSVFLFCGGFIPLMSYIFSKQGSIDVEIICNKYVRQKAVNETTACQIAKSEKRTNLASTFVEELDNAATEHREASSDYFALAPVNQLDEVVSQSMIP